MRAAATASGAHVVALAGASLFSMYVGEGEALLRSAFQRARQAAPSIVFLDELDALVGALLPPSLPVDSMSVYARRTLHGLGLHSTIPNTAARAHGRPCTGA